MASSTTSRPVHLPGEEGIWMFVIGDMVMFTALFAVFLYYGGRSPMVFETSRHTLDQRLGLLNTGLMLTSSWAVATATLAARVGRYTLTKRLLFAAIGCGILFGCVKYVEWSTKLAHGITPATNDFYMFYFVLTGIHMVHVVIGTAVLLFLTRISWHAARDPDTRLRNLESGATFWHLVDLLWIILFALLYLLP